MNIILAYDDSRFFTVGTYVTKVLSQQSEINIVGHSRIPEDTGMCEEQCGLNADLIAVIDSGTHYKLHHHKGKLGKAKCAFWISDLHREDWSVFRLQMIREFRYDFVFYAQKDFKQKILDCGYDEKQIVWLPHAADPDIFRPMPWIEKKYDTGFVGFSNEKRDRIAKVVSEICEYRQFSTVWAWQAARKINELKIGLNVPVMNDVANMRTFEVLSCGLPLLIEKSNNGLEDLLEKDMYLEYSSDKELKELIVRLLASNELRKTMGERGREHILKYHTYRNRVNSLLATMGFEMLKSI
jgi:glycosyltransferase involved in cell wall biosynthesis